ncbi:MAG: DUF4177 domain-containing protein [Pseudomonadota bacterium]
MSQFEYKVVAAPARGVKAKAAKTPEARFSNALEIMMNEFAAEGWEYQRAETLPSTERSGLTSTTTTWRHVLVFRRLKQEVKAPIPVEPPLLTAPEGEKIEQPAPVPFSKPQAPDEDASHSEGATRMLKDNGVEDLSEVSGLTNSLTQLAASRKSDKPNDD